MASTMGLVRSFYGWLHKTRTALEDAADTERLSQLPTQYPTSIAAVTSIALQTARVLHETAFHVKSLYWARLFEGIQSKGWKGEIRSVDLDRLKIREELESVRNGLALQDSGTGKATSQSAENE